MNRHRVGIIVIAIGVILAIAAPVWKWAIAPMFIEIPNDLSIESVYEGTLKLYADADNMEFYPEGQEVTLPVTITRKDSSVPEKSDSEAAVIREVVEVVGPDKEVLISWDKYFALDRKTALNLPGHNSDRDREGYYVMLPMGAEQVTYEMWDDDTELTGDAVFISEETRDGNDFKDVTVYVYEAKGNLEPMLEPPLGLPEQLSGKEIKVILNDPSINLADDTMLPIEYLKQASVTIVAEPRTGAIVDLPAYHEKYYVNAGLPGKPANNIIMGELDYKQTSESVALVIDESAKYFALLDLVTMWLPLMLLVVGLIMIILGVLLRVRKQSADIGIES